MTRVSSDQLQRTMLANIQRAQQRMVESQTQMSSGYRVSKPSDDPAAAAQAMDLLSYQNTLEQHEKNINQARAWSVATESSVTQAVQLAGRARTLLLQGSNAALSTSSRQAVAQEISAIVDSLKLVANTKLGNEFLFSGTATDTAPFSTGSDVYNGNSSAVVREISQGVQVQVNVTAPEVFGDASSGLIKTLRDAAAHLLSGSAVDLATARTTDLAALDNVVDSMNTTLARLGETQASMDFHEARIGELKISTMELLSIARDTDLAKASVEYSQRQAALTAALKTGENIVRPSLVDFLR